MSAEDACFTPIFTCLVKLASHDIFKLAHQFGKDVEDFYDDMSYEKMIDDDNIETLIEDEILEYVYGVSSTLTNDEWIEKIADEEGNWIFRVSEMRSKILT